VWKLPHGASRSRGGQPRLHQRFRVTRRHRLSGVRVMPRLRFDPRGRKPRGRCGRQPPRRRDRVRYAREHRLPCLPRATRLPECLAHSRRCGKRRDHHHGDGVEPAVLRVSRPQHRPVLGIRGCRRDETQHRRLIDEGGYDVPRWTARREGMHRLPRAARHGQRSFVHAACRACPVRAVPRCCGPELRHQLLVQGCDLLRHVWAQRRVRGTELPQSRRRHGGLRCVGVDCPANAFISGCACGPVRHRQSRTDRRDEAALAPAGGDRHLRLPDVPVQSSRGQLRSDHGDPVMDRVRRGDRWLSGHRLGMESGSGNARLGADHEPGDGHSADGVDGTEPSGSPRRAGVRLLARERPARGGRPAPVGSHLHDTTEPDLGARAVDDCGEHQQLG